MAYMRRGFLMSSELLTSNDQEKELLGTARLIQHIRDNNVSWMVAGLVAYQMGILDKFLAYGAGMC
mgnify:CR=1 FL=1